MKLQLSSDLLHAFYEPPIYLIKSMGTRGESLSLFLGRAHLEPEPVYSLVDKNYAACRNAFIQGFRQVTPGLTEPDYQWRFEFMLSLIVCFLTRQTPIRQRCSNADDWQPADVLDRLIEFCSCGMTSNQY